MAPPPPPPPPPPREGDWRPIPDPTTLTTQQLYREIGALKEIMENRFMAMERSFDEKIAHQQMQRAEQLRSVQTQFLERDARAENSARDAKVAIDAALQAAKDAFAEQNKSAAMAIEKTERATTKQIDQQGELIHTTSNGLNDKIEDVKNRLILIEGGTRGGKDQLSFMLSLATMFIAVVAVIASVISVTQGHGPTLVPPPVVEHPATP